MSRSPAPASSALPRLLAAALVLLGPALAAPDLAAQAPTLDRVDSLVRAGSYASARGTLDQWWTARGDADAPGSQKARALMLRARLAPDPATAEPDYLAIVLGYPTSEHAPEALLRLGQGLLATEDAPRAAAYLQRLTADYPGWPRRPLALLWLARANSAARRTAAACTAARDGLRATRDPDLTAMLQVEAGAACSIGGTASPPSSAADEATGDWAVQSGAFRSQAAAQNLMTRLREAGFQPRLVRVPVNDLLRVRVGRFATAEQANPLFTRLRDLGFDAVVVRDAAREKAP